MVENQTISDAARRREEREAERRDALARLVAAGVDPIIPPDDCCAAIGVSRPTWHRGRKRGEFPPFEEISPGRKGLRLSILKQVLAGRRNWSGAASFPKESDGPQEPADQSHAKGPVAPQEHRDDRPN